MRLRAVVATRKESKPRNPNPKSTNCLKKKRPRQVPSAASETTQIRSAKPGAHKWRPQRKTTDVLKVPQSRRERERHHPNQIRKTRCSQMDGQRTTTEVPKFRSATRERERELPLTVQGQLQGCSQ